MLAFTLPLSLLLDVRCCSRSKARKLKKPYPLPMTMPPKQGLCKAIQAVVQKKKAARKGASARIHSFCTIDLHGSHQKSLGTVDPWVARLPPRQSTSGFKSKISRIIVLTTGVLRGPRLDMMNAFETEAQRAAASASAAVSET